MFGPVAWLVLSSFKTQAALVQFPPSLLPLAPVTGTFSIVRGARIGAARSWSRNEAISCAVDSVVWATPPRASRARRA